MNILQAIRAVDAKQRVPKTYRYQTFFGAYDFYRYIPVFDDKLCERCLSNFMTHWFRGSILRKEFPYLEIRDEDTLLPWVHPHCRCELWRLTTLEEYLQLTELIEI